MSDSLQYMLKTAAQILKGPGSAGARRPSTPDGPHPAEWLGDEPVSGQAGGSTGLLRNRLAALRTARRPTTRVASWLSRALTTAER